MLMLTHWNRGVFYFKTHINIVSWLLYGTLFANKLSFFSLFSRTKLHFSPLKVLTKQPYKVNGIYDLRIKYVQIILQYVFYLHICGWIWIWNTIVELLHCIDFDIPIKTNSIWKEKGNDSKSEWIQVFKKETKRKTRSCYMWTMTNTNNTNDRLNNVQDTPLRSTLVLFVHLCISGGFDWI